ncbi:hypothetical protein MMC30_001021 [Trapelia coarctata]|nr:hypothetical protein [Trapelia coarctata]
MGKVEPNERAAKSWLSSQVRPWLLIIDNADDSDIPLESYFPEGERGLILVTTRNPTLKVHGTFGPRSYHFTELAETESNDLLLKAADEPMPWSLLTQQSATDICKVLGCLPLALVHAGKTILARLCTLQNYLTFFEKNWNRIRKTKNQNSSHPVSDSNAIIYSSYEILYYGLAAKGTQASEDALDLLKVFSFLHRQRIRVEILLRAASNPKLEVKEQERRESEEKKIVQKPMPKTWAQAIKSLGLGFIIFLWKLGRRPVLPKVLRDASDSGAFDEFRLREALGELHQMSLIFHNPEDDSYSMHPVVHLWVRERPEMSIAEQAVWCHATATVLTQAILLPPLDDTEADENFRRDLLPHVDHVQKCEHAIRAKLLDNQKYRRRPWPVLRPRLDPGQAIQLTKFSLIYAQSGLWNEAEKLQLQVADFARDMLGMKHPATMDITLFLSGTYWMLGRGDEAADLQQTVLEACIKFRGKDDLKTLKVMDMLGVSRWQQARFQDALHLHEGAIEGLRRVQGDDHADTLRAIGNLGRVIAKDFRFTEAVDMHIKVVAGLSKESCLGPTHSDTLSAMDNLAMAYFDRAAHGYGHAGDADHAHELQKEVVERRKEKFGKEHPYTLWAACNLARIKGLRGDFDEALSIMRAGIPVAERNLGENHIGTLFGKLHLGRILLLGGQYQEAEKVLLEVVKAHNGARAGHPDRLLAMFSLVKCRNLQGKRAETVSFREEILKGARALFGENHAWEKYLLDPKNLADEPP